MTLSSSKYQCSLVFPILHLRLLFCQNLNTSSLPIECGNPEGCSIFESAPPIKVNVISGLLRLADESRAAEPASLLSSFEQIVRTGVPLQVLQLPHCVVHIPNLCGTCFGNRLGFVISALALV